MSNTNLKRADPKVLRPVIEKYVLENREAWHLDQNIYGGWDNTQIHHVIPVSIASEYERLFMEINKHSGGMFSFDVNSVENLLVLPSDSSAQALAAANGKFAAVHMNGDKQHREYSDQLRMKLHDIEMAFETENNSGDFTPEQAASRAANRIATLQIETAKLQYGDSPDAIKLYTHSYDGVLIKSYNEYLKTAQKTGPPIDIDLNDPKSSLTLDQKEKLAEFQAEYYARIDFDKNLPENINLRSKLGITVDNITNGSLDGPVLLATVGLLYEIVKSNQIKKGFSSIAESAADLGINVDANFFAKLVGEEILDATISAALGPIGWAKKLWEVYQSAQGIVGLVELAHARWPQDETLKTVADLIETFSAFFATPDGLDQILYEIKDGESGGIVITSQLADKLLSHLGQESTKLIKLPDGTAFYSADGLAAGQFISLLGSRGFEVISALRDKAIVVGISDLGEKFSITGLEFIDTYRPYVGNDQISEQAVYEAITGVRLLGDFSQEGKTQILDQLERAATFHPETNPAILINKAYAETLIRFGHEDEVFVLSDGQVFRVPGGLRPGEKVNLLKGERPGHPEHDPTVAFGLDTEGRFFEIDRNGVNYVVQVVESIGGSVGDADAAEALSERAAKLQEAFEVSLRDALEGDEDDDTLSGAEGDDVLDGDPSDDDVQGPRAPGPSIDSRQAVFSDSDGDGVLDAVTRVTSFSDGTQVRKEFKVDAKGVPITEGRVALYRFDQIIDGAAIGSIFGSQLGNALVGDNLFAQIGAGSVLSSVLGNFGEAIDLYFTDNGVDSLFFEGQRLGTGQELSFGEAIEEAFDDFGADLLSNLRSAGVSTASGFLAAELGEALGLDSGFEGQLFQTVAGKTIGTVANTVLDNISAINDASSILASGGTVPSGIFHGLGDALAQAGAGAVSTFIGGYLAREIVTAESQAGAIGGSLGGAIGSTIGFGLAGVGFLGSAIGSIGAGITAGLGTFFGISLGTVILPGVGAFLGTILGTLLGDVFDDLFGGSGYPKGTANIALDFESGLYYESGTNAANGGGAQLALVTSLAERSESIINSYLEMLGGENANSHSPNLHFYQVGPGSASQGLHISVLGPNGSAVHHTRLQPHEITGEAVDSGVEDAVLAAIKTIQVKGGDLYLKRAVFNSEAEDLRAFAGDLKIAEDYQAYLKEKAVIDALIAEAPNSAFAAGWLITLLRAEELGLTQWQESDFYGGLEGLLLSLDVEERFGIALEDVVVSIETEILENGTERRDLVLSTAPGEDGELIARISDFEHRAGFTLLSQSDATGTEGKDIWYAPEEGGTFSDTATWRDEHSHDVLIGGAGDDTIDGGIGWDFIRGGAGSDFLDGGAHEDTIYGGSGNDIILGDAARTLTGPGSDAGTDPRSVSGADANDGSTREWFGEQPALRGPLGHYNNIPERTPYGADKLYGGVGDDIIIGVGGSDLIFGGEGEDVLYGGEDNRHIKINQRLYDGDDYLEGGAGADQIFGGEGYDTASYRSSSAAVDIDLTRTGEQSGGHASGDILRGVEDIVGSAFGDILMGNAGSNTLDGGLGDDHLDGRGGIDTVSYFSSQFAVDVNLNVDASDPSLGLGRTIEIPADDPNQQREMDTLVSIESVNGSNFDDIIRGSSQASGILAGHGGDDVFEIAFDDAEVSAGAVATSVLGGAGYDTLSFASRSTGISIDLTDTTNGNVFRSIENLVGSAGHDVLMIGSAGGVIEGGQGDDHLFGGPGTSVYVFNSGDGSDVIKDMSYFQPSNTEFVLRGGSSHDVISFGAGIEFRHLVGELSAADLPDFLPEEHHQRRFETGNAVDFSEAGFQLGIRSLEDSADDYVTSVSELSDKIEITYGGHLEGIRFVDNHYRQECFTSGAEAGRKICYFSAFSKTYDVQRNAGAIEILQFADAGYIELGEVRHFVTGSAGDDYSRALSGKASWIFTGEGQDTLAGSAKADILVGGEGSDLLQGGDGGDQYTYWLGDGHDIIEDSGGLDALVFGGGITRSQLKVRLGTLEDAADPDGFLDATEDSLGPDLRIEVVDPDDETAISGSVTIRSYSLQGSMIERIRFSEQIEDKTLDADSSPERKLDQSFVPALSVEIALSDLLPASLGTSYADVLTAKDGEVRLNGHQGDDHLIGNHGENVLIGGAGADLLDGSGGIDWVSYEEAGSGVVVDMSQTRQADREGDHDEEGDVYLNIEGVVGSAYGDQLTGNQFDNLFVGNAGSDVIDGAAGIDTASYVGSDAGVTIDLWNGIAQGGHASGDTLSNIESLDGSAHEDSLRGDDGDNSIWGRGGDDSLFGIDGENHLYGGEGNDRLKSGAHIDHLFGDEKDKDENAPGGHDLFVFSGAHGADIVYDFEMGRDLLEFENIDISTLSLSHNGFDAVLTHSQGSVQLTGVQWMSLYEARDAVIGVGNILPETLDLDGLTVPELTLGAVIGNLFAESHAISNISMMEVLEGGSVSNRFELVEFGGGAVLKLKDDVSLNYEAEVLNSGGGDVKIDIRANGADGNYSGQSFDLTVTDLNDAPTEIVLSNHTVDEESPGAIVGDLSVVDEDIGDSHTLFIASPDTSLFEIVSNSTNSIQLKLKEDIALDWEALPADKKALPLVLKATDEAGATVEHTVYIGVKDILETITAPAEDGSSEMPSPTCDMNAPMTFESTCGADGSSSDDLLHGPDSGSAAEENLGGDTPSINEPDAVTSVPPVTTPSLHVDHFEFL